MHHAVLGCLGDAPRQVGGSLRQIAAVLLLARAIVKHFDLGELHDLL